MRMRMRMAKEQPACWRGQWVVCDACVCAPESERGGAGVWVCRCLRLRAGASVLRGAAGMSLSRELVRVCDASLSQLH